MADHEGRFSLRAMAPSKWRRTVFVESAEDSRRSKIGDEDRGKGNRTAAASALGGENERTGWPNQTATPDAIEPVEDFGRGPPAALTRGRKHRGETQRRQANGNAKSFKPKGELGEALVSRTEGRSHDNKSGVPEATLASHGADPIRAIATIPASAQSRSGYRTGSHVENGHHRYRFSHFPE